MPGPGGRRLGYGIGWRPEIGTAVASLPGVDFVEVIAEGVDPRRLPDSLGALRARGVPVIPHGVSLNLGGAERPDPARLAHLAEVATALGAPLVSEHVAFCRAGSLDSGHLLPVPRTRDALAVVVENVRIACAELPVPLALENIAPLLSWPDEDMTEGRFLSELAERTGAGLLVDVANLHTAQVNLGQEPTCVLGEVPLDRIAYVHVAGGVPRAGLWHDTHTSPVTEPILRVLAEVAARVDLPGVLLERDGAYPSDAELAAELAQIRTTVHEAQAARKARGARAAQAGLAAQAACETPVVRAVGAPRATGRWRARLPIHGVVTRIGGRGGPGIAVGRRGRLARDQRKLLAALVAGAGVPQGFDAERVAVQTKSLVDKRMRVVAHLFPGLVDVLGDSFAPLFRAYAAAHSRPPGGAHGDARAFARWARLPAEPSP